MKTKKSVIIIFVSMTIFMLTQTVKAQFPKDSLTGKVKYTGIIEIPNVNKEDIYKRAKTWIVTTLKSADNNTELDDANKERLVATGTIIVDSLRLVDWGKTYSKKAYINFKFLVLIKDNKLKYSIENSLLYYLDIRDELVESGLEDIKVGKYGMPKKNKAIFDGYVYSCIDKLYNKLILSFTSSVKTDENSGW